MAKSDTEKLQRELAQADLFLEWDALLLELMASICEVRTYNHGDIIFRENSTSEEMFIIANGEVDIKVSPPPTSSPDDTRSLGQKTIVTLRRGQNFGEVGLLDRGLRTASAVCAQADTRLIAIPHEKLMILCENVPRLGYELMRNLAVDMAMKIRNSDIEIRARLQWAPSSMGDAKHNE